MHRPWIGICWLSSLAVVAGCASEPSPEGGWERVVLHEVGEKLGCCAVGELDGVAETLEVALVDEKGGVHVAHADGSGGRRIAQVGGEMIQCAVGQADPATPGVEIVVVGMQSGPETPAGPGRAHVLRRVEGGDWMAEPIFDDDALLHAVAVGEGEVFVGGYSQKLYQLVCDPTGVWNSFLVADLPGAAKNAVMARDGVVVACTDGSVVLVRHTAVGWDSEVLHHRNAGRARLGHAGPALVCADDDGAFWWIGGGGEAIELHRERQKLRGAVLADLDPLVEGLEAATAGYGRIVRVFRRDGPGRAWRGAVISEEPDKIHHLAAGDLDPAPGTELVCVGFAGELVMFRRR